VPTARPPDRDQETAAAPSHIEPKLHVAQPQVDARLTARLQLRSRRPPPASEETSRAPRERSCLATALSAACQAGDRPLTLSVAPRFWISTNGHPDAGDQLEEPAPVPPHPRQKERHPRRRASSIDKCSQERLSPIGSVPLGTGREPATEFAVLPPRLRLPTLFRPLSLSRWRARPEAAPRAIHPWPPRAARRLSISATVTTHEHNCAIVQTPPTTPVVAHARSFLHFTYLGI
jgi:hypothetical protein